MKQRDQILTEALKTQDSSKLFALIEDAIQLVDFSIAQKNFVDKRLKQLEEQIKNLMDLNSNLEKTIWNKKK